MSISRKFRLRPFALVLAAILLAACNSVLPAKTRQNQAPADVHVSGQSAEQPEVAQQPAAQQESEMQHPAAEQQPSVPLTGKGQQFKADITDDTFNSNVLYIPVGATVVWTQKGQHTHTVTADDGSFDSGELQNGATFQHTFDQVGSFIYHCSLHGSAGGHGMSGAVVVLASMSQAGQLAPVAQAGSATSAATTTGSNPEFQVTGVKRVFYIAAVEVEWDYAPSGQNQITGQPFDDAANVFVQHGPDRIGKVYTKAAYREFIDDTFTTQKPIPPEWQHLGIMGPVIHAEVGDEIIVHYMNKTTIPTSMHPHGVFYKKDSEGAPYNDKTSGNDKADDAVPPGGTHTYIWDVPNRAGPGPMDPHSIMWMYHSHTDEVGDTNAGLMGAMIISAKGWAKADGTPKDVDREFVVTFSVMDENSSLYIQHNIETKTDDPSKINPDDEEFHESNLMHSMNGYVFGNLPGLVMKKGERVRWYVMAMGTEVDLHTPHWHGNVVTANGMRMDVISLLPASMVVADMIPDNPGVWLFHCHVNDHILAGMMSTYTVQP